jgi:endogenous inhibitor of DNA gyrase (YacG/DUF329 family)
MYKKLAEGKCPKCGRTIYPLRILKIDPKTKKKFYLISCPMCEKEFDIEDYEPFT